MVQEEFIKSFDNNPLYVRFNTPDIIQKEAKGIFILHHGFGDHSGRYNHVAQVLCDKNFIVVSFDARGMGKSGPSFGHCDAFQDLLLDVIYLKNFSKEKYNKNILGFIGHSFGGLVMSNIAVVLGKLSPPIFISSPCYNISTPPYT